MKCIVYDEDKFSKELILSFIEKTTGVSILNANDTQKADVVFVDGELNPDELQKHLLEKTQIVIISSNEKFVYSLFEKNIADFLYKPELSYERFLNSINQITSANR